MRLQHDRTKTDAALLQTYGLGISDYENMAVVQGGRCAICRARPPKDRRMAVDHDHETGEVRGLLCTRCNLLLGSAEDDVGLLARAIAYLVEVRS